MTFGYFVAGAFITFLSYALIPLLIALLRKKEITRGKYRGICYAWNIIALIFDFLCNVASGDARIKFFPYLIWTEVAVWIGNAILKSRSVLVEDSSKAVKDATHKEETATAVENKYVCLNCNTYHSGWYQTCPHCGAVGKMVKASLPKTQPIESSTTNQEKQTAPNTTQSMREITPIERPNLVPSVTRTHDKSNDEKPTTQKTICNYCRAIIPEGAKYCAKCGRAVASFPVAKYCRFCGSRLTEGSMYCHSCGKEVQLNLDLPQTLKEDVNREKDTLEHKQQNGDDFSMPSYSTESVLYKENKDYIDSLISEGGLNMKIALYVAKDVVLIESGIKDIDLTHDLEVVLRELILEYGLLGAVTRYSFVLGLFLQLGVLSQEEVAKHKDRLLFRVRQELEQSRENRP